LGAFSFYPTKNLGAFGDGGMIVTKDRDLAAKCRSLREYGWDHARISRDQGVNSRLDELQAAILRVKLRHLDEDNAHRCAIATAYDRLLNKQHLVTPISGSSILHVYHQYVIRTHQRGLLQTQLRQHGIETTIHYPLPVHQHPAFEDFARSNAGLPETERIVSEVLSLPMYPQLADAQVERVAQVINSSAAALPADRGKDCHIGNGNGHDAREFSAPPGGR
jgi:dTDP-4-amino-4,6-dideoxygalactose transaminase